MIVLAGDIGGTHARLARFQVPGEGAPELVDEWTADSPGYEGPAAIVHAYMDQRGLSAEADLDGICIAVAGPIRDRFLRVPNLGWKVDVARFAGDIGFPGARLINDFAAVGHGVLALAESDWAELHGGACKEGAPIAVLGPGTGLGHAYLVWDDGSYRVHASEGGHVDFAPRTETEWALAEHLRRHYGHASWERVVSGPGLVNIYRFLADTDPGAEVSAVREELEGGDAPAVVSRHGADGTDPLCARALEMFVSALGSLCGNVVLTLEAFGGVYIAGGIAPQILDPLRDGTFVRSFEAKGRLSGLLESVPVRVILDPRVGLKGSARVAAEACA